MRARQNEAVQVLRIFDMYATGFGFPASRRALTPMAQRRRAHSADGRKKLDAVVGARSAPLAGTAGTTV
jgi:hypothetical protein